MAADVKKFEKKMFNLSFRCLKTSPKMSKYWNSQEIVTIIIIIIIIIILNMHFLVFASLRKKLFWSLK